MRVCVVIEKIKKKKKRMALTNKDTLKLNNKKKVDKKTALKESQLTMPIKLNNSVGISTNQNLSFLCDSSTHLDLIQ